MKPLYTIHTELQRSLATEKPDLLIALGKAILVVFSAFTFVSGLVFTVWPLMQRIGIWLSVTIDGINNWFSEEPIFGFAMASTINISLTIGLIWVLRKWLLLVATYVAAGVSSLIKRTGAVRNRVRAREVVNESN